MTQELFQQAVILFKSGDRERAGKLLQEIVKSNPGNEKAWFGLVSCTDSIEEKQYYLQKVLEINPENSKASQLLKKMNTSHSSDDKGKVAFSTANFAVSLAIMILFVSVAWLFYKVNALEISLNLTESRLASTQTELKRTQSSLEDTRSTLTYVQTLARNANNYAHSHNSYSDEHLKRDITQIDNALNGVLSLNGVNFLWNTSGYPELELNNRVQIGFVAQELEQIYPELVSIDEYGLKTIDYAKLTPVLVEAIKQQQLLIADLQQQIDTLKQDYE